MSSKHCNQNYIYCNIDRHKKQSKVLMNTTTDDTRFMYLKIVIHNREYRIVINSTKFLLNYDYFQD